VKADLGTNTLTRSSRRLSLSRSLRRWAAPRFATASTAATAGTGAQVLTTGLLAWGTTIHELPVTPGTPATTYGVTETAFSNATLSAIELTRMTSLCAFIRANGSGYGICKSCRVGGLGASAK